MTAKKPAELRQRRGTKDTVVELVPGVAAVPAAPDRWLPETVADWSTFWLDDELRSVVRDAHQPALVRLFDWRDKLHRQWRLAETLREAVGGEHMTAGSTGQMKANPLYERAEKAEALALQIEGRIEALEDRFGLSPGALMKIGVDFQRRENLAATNARLTEAIRGSTDGRSASDDPRALPGDSAVGSS